MVDGLNLVEPCERHLAADAIHHHVLRPTLKSPVSISSASSSARSRVSISISSTFLSFPIAGLASHLTFPRTSSCQFANAQGSTKGSTTPRDAPPGSHQTEVPWHVHESKANASKSSKR